MARILRPHPQSPVKVATVLDGTDDQTVTGRHHRLLTEAPAAGRSDLVEFLRGALAQHHADDDKRKRIARINKSLTRQGLPPRSLYPTNVDTRKGNLAEVVLAEYLVATEQVSLPVYRLRHNPNIDQSMKGDDVLAFDLDSKPMRILVGESKFRSTPRREDVEDIVEGLLRSHRAKIPASLQFVADQLYLAGKIALARRVENCQLEIVRNNAQLDYVGLLLGTPSAAHCVTTYTPRGQPRRLVMISLGVTDPQVLVDDCFRGLA